MEIQTNGKPIDSLLEKVLCMNILSSDYFKELYRLKTYHEVIDEIYNQVDHVEPWMTGNCRGPSTSFCLLYKFFTMKLTVKQMHGLLKHKDSPYIRAVIVPYPDFCFPWVGCKFLMLGYLLTCFIGWSLLNLRNACLPINFIFSLILCVFTRSFHLRKQCEFKRIFGL